MLIPQSTHVRQFQYYIHFYVPVTSKNQCSLKASIFTKLEEEKYTLTYAKPERGYIDEVITTI